MAAPLATRTKEEQRLASVF